MKVKNIVFSGFMAAILSATGANAAISVASKAYVDKYVGDNGSVTTELSELKQTVTDNKTATDNALDLKANTADVEATYATKAFVGSLEGKDAATIVEYIDDKTADIASGTDFSSLTERVGAAEGKITALETLTGAEGQIAKDIAQALTDAKADATTKANAAQAAAEATAAADATAKANAAQAAAEATAAADATSKANAAQAAAEGTAAADATEKANKALDDAKTYVDGKLGALSQGAISETQNKVAANELAIEGLLDSVAAMDTAYKAADAGLDTAVKAAQADATQALADAAAASTAAGTALTDAKTYADEQDAAQTETITAAYEAADTTLDTNLKKYADDKAAAEAKAVADTLKFLATAEVPDECLTGDGGSNMCVLTMTSTGAFAWTPLTTPVE